MKVIKLNESDLVKIIKRVITESTDKEFTVDKGLVGFNGWLFKIIGKKSRIQQATLYVDKFQKLPNGDYLLQYDINLPIFGDEDVQQTVPAKEVQKIKDTLFTPQNKPKTIEVMAKDKEGNDIILIIKPERQITTVIKK